MASVNPLLTVTDPYDTVILYFPAKEDVYGLQVKGSVQQYKEDRDEEDRSKEEKIVRSRRQKGGHEAAPFFVFVQTCVTDSQQRNPMSLQGTLVQRGKIICARQTP